MLRVGVASALVVAAIAGCGSGSGGRGSDSTSVGGSRSATVTITAADGCQVSSTSFPAGALTFDVTNRDATATSEVELQSGERIVGEKEDLPPGFSGTFSVNVDGGNYDLYCPGARQENVPLVVTGHAPAPAGGSVAVLLATGTRDYAAYVTTQIGNLVSSVEALQVAIASGDLTAARSAYEQARPYYEKIEPVAESFSVGKDNLDADIDARINDVPRSRWEGFHPIEKSLFEDNSVKSLTRLASGLVANAEKLQQLTADLIYQPFQLANGAQNLLDEVASSKITGEEERYSHIDLLDFQANDEGAEQAFADLQPALIKIDVQLTDTIGSRFSALDALVDSYRTGANPSGFVYYGALATADKRKLAAAVTAVQEPLSQVASKVADA